MKKVAFLFLLPWLLGFSCNQVHTVGMQWQPSPTLGVEYKVYRSQVNGGPYSAIATGLTSMQYTDTVSSGTYYYVTTAYYPNCVGAHCESNYSDQIVAVVP